MSNGQLLLCVLIIILFILLHNNINIEIRKSNYLKKNELKKELENFIAEYDVKETPDYIRNLRNEYRKENRKEYRNEYNNKTLSKVAIVSMVTKQPDFKYWLEYHLEVLKLDHIFLRVEDSPEYEELFKKYPGKITAKFYNKEDIDTKHNYLTIMDRQKENVNSGISKAKTMDIDYIFHTDADELIYVNPDNKGTSKDILLRKYLDEVDDKYSCIHFKNFEAVFPKNNLNTLDNNKEQKCFNTNKFIDCKKGHCLSYANGKSCGRVKKNIRFHGPHYFSGENYNMPDDKITVLHFDSCTYNQWETKFDLLKDTNEEKMKKIPFHFYKNSIRKLKKCGGEKKREKTCKKELIDYYESEKVKPFYNESKPLREFNFDM